MLERRGGCLTGIPFEIQIQPNPGGRHEFFRKSKAEISLKLKAARPPAVVSCQWVLASDKESEKLRKGIKYKL